MSHVLSENACLYLNSGTYGAPSWTEVTNAKDVTLGLEGSEVDVSTRAGQGWTESVQGLLTASIDFNMLWDRGSTDAAFLAIQAAFFAKTSVEMLVLDGDVAATDGLSQGLRAICMVSTFNRNETLGEALTVDVSLKPIKNTSSPPSWWTQP
jgi:hypothetical protein